MLDDIGVRMGVDQTGEERFSPSVDHDCPFGDCGICRDGRNDTAANDDRGIGGDPYTIKDASPRERQDILAGRRPACRQTDRGA